MGILSPSENELRRRLITDKILTIFDPQELKDKIKNGGVAICCGDGDIDLLPFHAGRISDRPHKVSPFGGPLVLAPSFAGYRPAFAMGTIENMTWGMEAKDTKDVIVYLHYPCAVARKFNIGMSEALDLAAEIKGEILNNPFFTEGKITFLCHLKRRNKGGQEEQNTYHLNL